MLMPRFYKLLASTVAVAVATGICAQAGAQTITRIEEDWHIRVVQPDAEITAPQFTSVLTPDHNDQSTYITFEFNHSTDPEFARGGLQIQAWRDDLLYQKTLRLSEESLELHNEHIRWTQFVALDDNNMVAGLKSLQSTTWGDVPLNNAYVVFENYQKNLSNYRLANSLEYSTVGFSGNRVGYMFLTEVRIYSGNQLLERVQIGKNVNRGHPILWDQ